MVARRNEKRVSTGKRGQAECQADWHVVSSEMSPLCMCISDMSQLQTKLPIKT